MPSTGTRALTIVKATREKAPLSSLMFWVNVPLNKHVTSLNQHQKVITVYFPFRVPTQSLAHHPDRPASDGGRGDGHPAAQQRRRPEGMEVLGEQGGQDKADQVDAEGG